MEQDNLLKVLRDAVELLKEIDGEMYKRGMVGYSRDRRFIAAREAVELNDKPDPWRSTENPNQIV